LALADWAFFALKAREPLRLKAPLKARYCNGA
jgi:hypothetical protein